MIDVVASNQNSGRKLEDMEEIAFENGAQNDYKTHKLSNSNLRALKGTFFLLKKL